MNNIVLIGFMGTGKSSVSRRLSDILALRELDTDAMIEERSGMKIAQIFAVYGQEYFRDLESQLLEELSDTSDTVISCGGGIILRPENRRMLRECGTVFLLTARPETIMNRLRRDSSRPLLDGSDREAAVRRLMNERKELYRESADHCISTDGRSLDDICREIIKWEER